MKLGIIDTLVRINLIIAIIALSSLSAFAQNGLEPRIDYQGIINGNVSIGGNALVTCDEESGRNCEGIRNGTANGGNATFNSFRLIDVAAVGGNDATSSFTYNLPAGAVVQRAILYNSFFDNDDYTPRSGADGTFSLDLPSSAGFNFVPLSTSNAAFSTSYYRVAVSSGIPIHQNRWDVTPLVSSQSNASGTYTFRSSRVDTTSLDANGSSGQTALIAEWHMYIVYTVAGSQLRSVSVVEGHVYFGGSNGRANVDAALTNLIAPSSGAITATAGIIVNDGDQDRTGDGEALQFGRDENSLATLDFPPQNPATNPYNSTITAPGTPNPSYVNNLSVDIDTFDVSSRVANSQTRALFRLSSGTINEGVGFELAYLSIDNAAVNADYGDVLNSYGTTNNNSGAFHVITPTTLRLGATVDSETDGQPNASATGDGADEDGITTTFGTPTATSNFTVNVNVFNQIGNNATLYGWLDYNRNGIFDANERAMATVVTGTQGTVQLTFTPPANGFVVGDKYLRLRLTTDALTLGTGTGADSAARGSATNGEVEDYLVPSTTTAAAITVAGKVTTPKGKGLMNARVTLIDSDGNQRTVSTTTFGRFSFSNVRAGETFIISVNSKRYSFESQAMSFNEDSNEIRFIANR